MTRQLQGVRDYFAPNGHDIKHFLSPARRAGHAAALPSPAMNVRRISEDMANLQ